MNDPMLIFVLLDTMIPDHCREYIEQNPPTFAEADDEQMEADDERDESEIRK